MPQPTTTRTEVRNLPLQTRSAPIASVDEAGRKFEFVWTTGARVKRFDYNTWSYYLEELSLDPAHIRLGRLQSGAPLLNSHQQWDLSSVLGVHEDAWMTPTEGRAVARFSDRDETVNAYWRDVVNKIIRNISTGYIVHRFMKLDPEQEGGLPIWQAIDWEPCENSLVPIGADPLAGVRSLGELEPRPDPDELLAQASNAVGGRTFPCEFVTRATPQVPPTAAPAANTPTDPNEEEAMRKFRRTPVAEAAETTASTAGGAVATPTPAAPAPAQRSEADILAAERTRAAGVRTAVAAFRRTAHGTLMTDDEAEALVNSGATVEQARGQLFQRLEAQSSATQTRSAANIQTEQDEQKQRRADLAAAMSHRANPSVALPESARRFRGYTLFELARRSLEMQGLRTEGLGRNELVAIAMSNSDAMGFRSMHGTSDFTIALASTVNRSLRAAYTSAPQTFKAWARPGTLSDFRAATRVAMAGNLGLEKVNEQGEFRRGTLKDAGETIQLATYGKVVAVSRQVIINDDLDFLGRLPAMFGRAAADFESRTVYSVITSNPVMSDGNALFSAAHGNLGTPGVIGETTLSEGRKMMRQQVDPSGNGEPLNLVGKYVLVPSSLETTAQKQFQAVIVAGKVADSNVFRDSYEPVVEPRLDADSLTSWYLMADKDAIDTLEYAYLDGQEGLFTEERMGFDVDGLEVKARLDFAAKAIDWRGMFKNAGA